MADRPHLLILGGTGEALALADAARAGWRITYSLAGRTQRPAVPEGVEVRTGGFGGADALADWLRAGDVAALVDATHPFADTIAANAAAACDAAGVPRLKLLRPAWAPLPGDDWRDAANLADAATRLSGLGQDIFLSVGRRDLGAFAGVSGKRFLVRTVDPLAAPPLAGARCICGRGPFSVADEISLLREYGIAAVVSKNAGGDATYAKIEAARSLGLPVVMIRRPAPPQGDKEGDIVEDADAATNWLAGRRGRL